MKRYPNFLLALLLVCWVGSIYAQIEKVEPPNWWVGMENNELQLLIKGKDIQEYVPEIDHVGVSIKNIHTATSKNYLFIDLEIVSSAKAGRFDINFRKGRRIAFSWPYELKMRDRASKSQKGFDASDVIYLITPDRFANSNPDNDAVEGMLEQEVNRADAFGRHGGDIQGMIDHLDYIEEMGFTAIWPSPLLENDMPQWSYHGYAITDYYEVDARFGTLADYVRLADEASKRGIKLIMDGVVNHCGVKHWWMADPPFDDWINYQQAEEIVVTNHRRSVNQDAYAAEVDKTSMSAGWFVPTMPDLNQRNPFMSAYLIQNSIWWIEVLGLGGIRQDTYPYPYKDFLTEWTCRIMNEYPDFNIVGEEWSTNPLIVAYWQQGKNNTDDYQSCLRSVMDFPIQDKLVSALTGDDKQWGKGLVELYDALANDFVYANPLDIMTFGDNHDMDRIATQLGGDPALMQMAMTYLLTIRGIPQVYYGTEIMMNNDGFLGSHGIIRSDFPGGWAGDEVNAITGDNLSPDQMAIQQYVKRLLNWRKNETTIHKGKTKHFAPQNGTYAYFRYTDGKTIMVVLNKNEEKVYLDATRFKEIIGDKKTAKNIMSGKPMNISSTISVPARYALILEIQ